MTLKTANHMQSARLVCRRKAVKKEERGTGYLTVNCQRREGAYATAESATRQIHQSREDGTTDIDGTYSNVQLEITGHCRRW